MMTNIITKNYIKIPLYKRPIMIGGKVYKKLLKAGTIVGDELYKYDTNILYKIDLADLIRDKINQLNTNIDFGYKAVKGRGIYKNFIIKKRIDTDSETVFTET